LVIVVGLPWASWRILEGRLPVVNREESCTPTRRAYHAWIALPSWRSDSFTAAAAEHGIAVAPATALTVDRSHAPNAIRGALASPPPAVLASSLATLNALAVAGPQAAPLERLEPTSASI
jgi:DNA-binding transcriptional MocR family regulator